MLVYTDAAVTVVNISNDHLSLDDLILRRTSGEGDVESTFSIGVWKQANDQAGISLRPGDCYQLLHPADAPPDVPPDPILLPSCDSLQDWFVAGDEDWLFWIPDDASKEFQVIQDEQIIHTCSLDDALCKFYLPKP